MTNYEKFKEVFNIEPDTDDCLLECPSGDCEWFEELEKAWESISDVAEGGYVDMEEVKLWFAKWLGKDEEAL